MRLLLLDAAAGIVLLATITLSARRAPQKRSRHVRALGWMLIAGPCRSPSLCTLPGACPRQPTRSPFSRLWLPSRSECPRPQVDDEDDERGDADDDSPPWWPEFEREFRAYAPAARAAADHHSALTLSRRAE